MLFARFVINIRPAVRFLCREANSSIMKYLNVAEKNDAAKNIASILSGGNSTRREGYSQYNKIYEFNATVRGQPVQMVMTSVSGHLLNYEFVAAFQNWKSCSPLALFDAPVTKICPENSLNIKRTLEREARSCQGLIIWTDCDREGENIGFEVIEVCTNIKRNLQIYRAKFSEITRPSVFRALNNLEEPKKNISDAVDVRQELDLRTGAAFTRLQTLRLQRVFPDALADKLISYGSCQFPTLGFVVERYKAIEEFVPESFWKLIMSHTIKEMKTDFIWKRGRLFDKVACQVYLDICKENPTATVEKVENKPKSKWRPVPLDTIEMEKNVSKKLKINAKECMKIAEKLYTQGLISYPRTETNIFPKELNLNALVEQQTNDNAWGPFARRVINEGGCTPRQGKKSDQAHPPIHPTKYSNALNGNEKRLYEYIVRHFLACVHKDAQGFETTVHVDIANEKFTAKGLVVLEKNYLDVYIYEKWNAKEIYGYEEGDTFTPTVLDMTEGSTSPPSLLTEADLITLMEKHGIGTDATHAEHIETIKSREYVGLHENIYFVPGTLGMGLVEGYNNMELQVSLAKPELRAEFENDLKLICEGRKDPEVVRAEQIEKYKAVYRTVMEKMQQIDQSLANRLNDRPQHYDDDEIQSNDEYKPVLKCPKCGKDMVLKNKKDGRGKFLSCVGYPNCKNAVWFGLGMEMEVTNESCRVCGPNVKKLKVKFRQNPFYGEPNPNVLCIGGCDLTVLETLDINPSSVRNGGNQANDNHANNRTVNAAPPRQRNNLNNWLNNGAVVDNNANRTINRPPPVAKNNNNNNSNNNTRRPLDALPGPSGRTNSTNSFNNDDPQSTIVCSCNQDAILLTVKKEGPNTGRQFYKCQNGSCNFFQWATEEERPAQQNVPRGNNDVQCNCGDQAALRTVAKDGPNKGRQFYCCSKPREQGCNFFKWADETDNPGAGFNGGDDDDRGNPGGGRGNPGPWRGKGRGKSRKTTPYTRPGATNKVPKKRKCGLCGQEGHIRSKCPNA